MEAWTESALQWLLVELALPEVGLSAIFIISLVSATLLPLGSEPAVFAYVKLAPHMFWPAVLVGTVGNTLGGVISYYTGRGAHVALERWREKHPHHHQHAPGASTDDSADAAASGTITAKPIEAGGRWHQRIQPWLQRLGPAALLLSWLPAVGDPLCAVAGWLRLAIWPCIVYMAIGKFLRYTLMTAALLWMFAA